MEDYLAVIFLEIPPSEWFHDKTIERSSRRIRPDYRCERLKLMIEFDGVQHYQKPERIKATSKINASMRSWDIKLSGFPISFS